MDANLILIGAAIGVLIGLTGMGGGALMTPILIFFFGVTPTLAVGSDLLCNAITKVFGAVVHLQQKTVNLRLVLYLAVGSLPSSVLGVAAIERLKLQAGNTAELYVTRALGSTLILVSAVLFSKVFFMTKTPAESVSVDMVLGSKERNLTILVGVVVGFLVGLTSIGSGTLVVSAIVMLFPALVPRMIVGTDVFHGALLVSMAGFVHYWVGNTEISLVMNLLLGSVPGVVVGSRLSALLPVGFLRLILASVLMVTGLKLI